jgi:hypothetical protein
MDVGTFAEFFRGDIRSWLDWNRVLSGDYEVTEHFASDEDALADLSTVWYTAPNGDPADWRRRDASRLLVRQASSDDALAGERRPYVDHLAFRPGGQGRTHILVLPCYETARGTKLILDGNHRAVAAYRGKHRIKLITYSVKGADDPFVLPDLLHEVRPRLDKGLWAGWCQRIEAHFRGSNDE